MHVGKYGHSIVHIHPTVLLPESTYKPHVAAHNSKNRLQHLFNFFIAYGLGPKPLLNSYIYAKGLGLRPLYIFSLDSM